MVGVVCNAWLINILDIFLKSYFICLKDFFKNQRKNAKPLIIIRALYRHLISKNLKFRLCNKVTHMYSIPVYTYAIVFCNKKFVSLLVLLKTLRHLLRFSNFQIDWTNIEKVKQTNQLSELNKFGFRKVVLFVDITSYLNVLSLR